MSSIDDLLEMDLSLGTDDDWTPTPHGRHLAAVLAQKNLVADKEVLELGAGVANHTVIILRQQPKSLVATEITEARCATTRINVEHNCGPDMPIEYRVADWLNTQGQFDLIITNPPFARSGQRNRRYFIDSLILDAHKRLRDGGELVFVQSSMADIEKTRCRLAENRYDVEILGMRQGPFRDYYFEDESFMEEIRTVPDGFEMRGDTYYEKLVVFRATLQEWQPPVGSH